MLRTTTFLLTIILFINLGCAPTRILSGRVVDATSGEPVQEVLVIVTWIVCEGRGHCTHYCAAIDTTHTDVDGSYRVSDFGYGERRIDVYHPVYTRFTFRGSKASLDYAAQLDSKAAPNPRDMPAHPYWCDSRPGDTRVSAQANRHILDLRIHRAGGDISFEDYMRWVNVIETQEFDHNEANLHRDRRQSCILRRNYDRYDDCYKGPIGIISKPEPDRMMIGPGDPESSYTDRGVRNAPPMDAQQ